MINEPQENVTKGRWEHVHQCPQCGHVVRAEEIPRPALVTGVMTCPDCEWSGPINVQIVKEGSIKESGKPKGRSRVGAA